MGRVLGDFINKKNFEGFYKKNILERQNLLKKEFSLTDVEVSLLNKEGSLKLETANQMIENVVGNFSLPLGVATNFNINGKDYIVPFVIEEASVVAAASNAAKLSSGFITNVDDSIMIGQLQVIKCKNTKIAKENILKNKKEILNSLINKESNLIKAGGGPRDLTIEILKTKRGEMLDVKILVDVKDAMGANAINTMLEKIAPKIEEYSNGEVLLKILSNLAIYRRAQAKTIWKKNILQESTKGLLSGEKVIERILDAYEFAVSSPFRCATHNKGIMNGIDAVVIATGNDFRAIEAGAHAFSAFEEKYSPLTKFYKNKDGDLVGEIDIPLAIGTIGGVTKIHPLAQMNLKILNVKSASELASIIASVGLAQNFAALRALVSSGIQEGHMKLHAKNIAFQAGAKESEINEVVKKMLEEKNVSQSSAEKIIKKIRK